MLVPPSFDDITAAADRISGRATRTPLLELPAVSRRFERRLLFKPESLQRTGSFKFRGAFNFLARLDPALAAAGVVAYSSGNHAQGVAAAARALDIPATIFMPEDAPQVKVARAEADGARVVRYDRDRDDREELAATLAADTGATLLPPYEHPDVIAGQGTVGLEMAEDCRALGVDSPQVLVPVGGGGLAAGIALALESELPGASVAAVEPDGFHDHGLSLAAGERVAVGRTSGSICDSLLAPIPGELTFEINRRLLQGAYAVSDESVLAAMRLAFEAMRIVVEPGGSVGLAAVLSGAVEGDGPVVVVLSGGNVDLELLGDALRRRD